VARKQEAKRHEAGKVQNEMKRKIIWNQRFQPRNASLPPCLLASLPPCLLASRSRHVRGPKPLSDAELTIVPGGSDNRIWGQPTGGGRVWRQIQTQSIRR